MFTPEFGTGQMTPAFDALRPEFRFTDFNDRTIDATAYLPSGSTKTMRDTSEFEYALGFVHRDFWNF